MPRNRPVHLALALLLVLPALALAARLQLTTAGTIQPAVTAANLDLQLRSDSYTCRILNAAGSAKFVFNPSSGIMTTGIAYRIYSGSVPPTDAATPTGAMYVDTDTSKCMCWTGAAWTALH